MTSWSHRTGQVFLKNTRIAEYEVDLLDPLSGESILEIGPGEGVITGILANYDIRLTAVEKDRDISTELSEKFRSDKISIVNRDILEFPTGSYDGIIGNIPYYISSPILFRLYDFDFRRAVLMVQKEFADKLVTESDISRLYVNANVRFEIKISRYVSNTNFYPVPKVDSAIIYLKRKKYDYPFTTDFLDEILIKMFSKKRKMISNIFDDYPKDFSNRRPSDLSFTEIVDLARYLYSFR
ncbi:MAG: 16S rRNA (adenine(1518)-N(6)/adenine(1519)-N(6))-dimethyltransferase RsmA [Thermoplasmata archaeon]